MCSTVVKDTSGFMKCIWDDDGTGHRQEWVSEVPVLSYKDHDEILKRPAAATGGPAMKKPAAAKGLPKPSASTLESTEKKPAVAKGAPKSSAKKLMYSKVYHDTLREKKKCGHADDKAKELAQAAAKKAVEGM